MRFCVLASGSSGNASLLTEGTFGGFTFGVLLDFGLGPRTLARRMACVGASWDDVHAVLLTHVHGDHWNENTLAHLGRRHIPLYCHQSHAGALKYASPAFADLLDNDGVRLYELGAAISLEAGVVCLPLPLRHDGGVTCGFRLEGPRNFLGERWALGYAADLGTWDAGLADAFADVDVLALEFNHDERLERQSGRAVALIERVLGESGHLSNAQAAELLRAVLARSARGRLLHLIQLHLSRHCNRPELAQLAAHAVLQEHNHSLQLHTAEQGCPGMWLAPYPYAARKTRRMQPAFSAQQPWLPGWEA